MVNAVWTVNADIQSILYEKYMLRVAVQIGKESIQMSKRNEKAKKDEKEDH